VKLKKMGKNNAKKKRSRNTTKRSKGAYQNTDDAEDQPSFGLVRRNPRRSYSNAKPKYNSDDDYTKLRKTLDGDGLEIVEMSADGNCLFRSLSDQLFGDYGNAHYDVRSAVCDFMEKNKEDFQVFLVFEDEDDEDQNEEDARDFEHYLENMRQEGEWGGNLEVVAAARLYQRTITVYSETLAAFTIDHGDSKRMDSDLCVSYHDNDHYNSVRNKLYSPKPSQVNRPSLSAERDVHIKNNTNEKMESSEIENLATSLLESSITTKSEKTGISIQKNVKRSAPCPCGSGLRYKKCCLAKQKETTRMDRMKAKKQCDEDGMSDVNDDRRSQEMFRIVAI